MYVVEEGNEEWKNIFLFSLSYLSRPGKRIKSILIQPGVWTLTIGAFRKLHYFHFSYSSKLQFPINQRMWPIFLCLLNCHREINNKSSWGGITLGTDESVKRAYSEGESDALVRASCKEMQCPPPHFCPTSNWRTCQYILQGGQVSRKTITDCLTTARMPQMAA